MRGTCLQAAAAAGGLGAHGAAATPQVEEPAAWPQWTLTPAQGSSFHLARQLTEEASQLLRSASASTPSVSDGLVSSAILEMLRCGSAAPDELLPGDTTASPRGDPASRSVTASSAARAGLVQSGVTATSHVPGRPMGRGPARLKAEVSRDVQVCKQQR